MTCEQKIEALEDISKSLFPREYLYQIKEQAILEPLREGFYKKEVILSEEISEESISREVLMPEVPKGHWRVFSIYTEGDSLFVEVAISSVPLKKFSHDELETFSIEREVIHTRKEKIEQEFKDRLSEIEALETALADSSDEEKDATSKISVEFSTDSFQRWNDKDLADVDLAFSVASEFIPDGVIERFSMLKRTQGAFTPEYVIMTNSSYYRENETVIGIGKLPEVLSQLVNYCSRIHTKKEKE